MDGTRPIGMVVIMGLVTVFVCLICLIVIMKLMSLIIGAAKGKGDNAAVTAPTPAPAIAPAAPAVSVNKQQIVAAIGAAIAEDMGTDVSHIKIHSIRKI